jgi:hypothetical protein
MRKIEMYRELLRNLTDWEPYLLSQSGLPGPRSNLELAEAAADIGSREQIAHWLTFDAQKAPVNTPQEFLTCCGVLGLGRLVNEGEINLLENLQILANDPRWRIRESVAMAFQRIGDQNLELVLETTGTWSNGTWLEQRAAVAALAEPRLLKEAEVVRQVLELFDRITAHVLASDDRKPDEFRVLRQALGYGWSVVVVALPDDGKDFMEKWCANPDKDIQWIMKENFRKNRLLRMDIGWVNKMQSLILALAR